MAHEPTNRIQLDFSRCNACGACVRTCPEVVFTQAGAREVPTIEHPDRCLGCMACEEDCQHRALRVLRLPPGMTAEALPQPAAGLDAGRIYDLVVVGAGPAGLAAAIRGRALGLGVAVVDRLPSERRSHHPDGGLLFTGPDIYTLREDSTGVRIEELDLLIPTAAIRDRLRDMILAGPAGLASRKSRGKGHFLSVSKDTLVELMVARARDAGATVTFNTKVSAIHPGTATELARIELEQGAALTARVVISAEGSSGRLAEKAGIPVNETVAGWSFGMAIDQDTSQSPTDEFGFMVGRMPTVPLPMLVFWADGGGRKELVLGTLQKSRHRELEQPLSEVVATSLAKDPRLPARLGVEPQGRSRVRDGCRAFARRLPRRATNGRVLAVGDAITACGMLTNLAAAKTGDLAAQAAGRGLSNAENLLSELAQFDPKVFGLSQVRGMAWMHKLLIEAPMQLSEPDLASLYGMVRHLDMGAMSGGRLRAGWAMARFLGSNLLAMGRRPDLRAYLDR